MFWKHHPSSQQIDTAFFKEDLTLNELLDQENVLQELKSQNAKLIDFITRADIMAQLVALVTEEPSAELDENERYRRPNLACEVLTTDIRILNERLSEKTLLAKLYSFLEAEPPLNPLLASFFSRTLSMLICRKLDQNWYSYQFTCLQVLDFFKSRDNSLALLLKHLGTSAIMDLTLKLITQMEGEDVQRIIFNWLENEGLVSSLMSLFDPTVDPDRQYNAAQLLCDTIRKCKDTATQSPENPDPIFTTIQSPEMIEKLLGHMLGGELSESSIVGGISVLLTLLEPSLSSTGSGEPANVLNPPLLSVVSAIVLYLPKLHNLLIDPPKKGAVKLACGIVDPPLGNTRLSVIKLLVALIATNVPEVNVTLDELSTMHVLLDLFFQYTWNNFLHTQVDKCLEFALNASSVDVKNNPLISNIFIKCRLLQRILEAWDENSVEQCKEGGKRRGYMGHLTNIANAVMKQSEGGLGDFLNENVDADTMISWNHFVEETLAPINLIKQKCLGGKHPAHNTPKDVDVGFKDIIISVEDNIQNIIPKFQEKMRDCLENCRFTNFSSDHIQEDDSDLKSREEVFNKMCSTMGQLGPDVFSIGQNLEDDVWVDLPNCAWNTSDDMAPNSSDEDEKGAIGPCDEGYVDTDLWSSVGVGTPIVDPGNPWKSDGAGAEANSDEGWADFGSNFVTESDFDRQPEQHTQDFPPICADPQSMGQNPQQLATKPPPASEPPAYGEVHLAGFSGHVPMEQSDELPLVGQKLDFSDSSIVEKFEATEHVESPTSSPIPSVDSQLSACADGSTDEGAIAALSCERAASGEDRVGQDVDISDNNANLSNVTPSQEDTDVREQELIDNFRFLSKKGMIADDPVCSEKQEVKHCAAEEKVLARSAGGMDQASASKGETPGDAV